MAGRAKNTLSDQIRKTIGLRILVCISLYLVFFISITAYDFSRGMTQVESRVKSIAAQLDEYVISQILINNDQSIKVKLKEEALHNDMIISWNKSDQLSSRNIKWSFPMGWSYKSEISTLDGRHYGALVFKGSFFNDKGFMFEMLVRVSFLILFLIFMLVILYPLSLKIPKTLFVDPLLSLLSLLKTPETYKANSSVIMRTSELKQIEESILYLLEKTKKDSRNAAIGQIASQVAHDIRSPLAALNVLMEQNHQMKQDQVQLLQNSISRINDIANNLLKDNEEQLLSHFRSDTDGLEECFIFPSVNAVLLEKKLELSNKVEIRVKVSDEFHMIYGRVNRSVLSRIISNIINNACESFQEAGLIIVELSSDSSWYTISVKDNGCGMSEEVQQKIFEYGFSYGKEHGTGIGLACSKVRIDSWGGKIDVKSKLGCGTEVIIKLPLLRSPTHLATNINIIENAHVVIVDDDQAVHDAWETCFNHVVNEKNVTFKIVHLYSSSEFEAWYLGKCEGDCHHFFIDYDLNDDLSGVGLIEKYHINTQSYLVTSKYDDLTVIDECKSNNILLIPKNVFQYVDIQICYRNPSAILIDDDVGLGKAWKYKAEFSDNKLNYFSTMTQFNALKKFFDPLTPIFVDSDLKDEKTGEEYAKNIYDSGFCEIYLATGFSEHFKHKPEWIKSIVSKDPPF